MRSITCPLVGLNPNECSSSMHLGNCLSSSEDNTVFFRDPTSTTCCLFISCQFHKVDSGILHLAAILQIEAELFLISASASEKMLSDHCLIFICLVFPFPFLNIRTQKTYP